MNLHSKFEPLQKVWSIREGHAKEFTPCPFCGQTGIIKGADGTESVCPKCWGKRGKYRNKKLEWQVDSPLTIGQIRIVYTASHLGLVGEEMFENFGSQQEHIKEEYMCIETGIGSGSVYHSDRLFVSQEEAGRECNKRNRRDFSK